jgi:phosphate transport system substrate-binding protein
VLKATKRVISPAAARYESSEQITDEVEKDPQAIGFIGLAYVRNNHAVAIGGRCGLATQPARYTVQTEVYPLARRLYLYTVGRPTDHWTRRIIDFSVSDKAQEAVTDAGFIDQSVSLEPAAVRADWLAQLAAIPGTGVPGGVQKQFSETVKRVARTSVALRFAPASTVLETKSQADVGRLARFLKSAAAKSRPFSVVGFSDSSGSLQGNMSLARQRALAVAAALSKYGVPVSNDRILAFGPAGPVACNDDERGRAINRRVEIWLDEAGAGPATPTGIAGDASLGELR